MSKWVKIYSTNFNPSIINKKNCFNAFLLILRFRQRKIVTLILRKLKNILYRLLHENKVPEVLLRVYFFFHSALQQSNRPNAYVVTVHKYTTYLSEMFGFKPYRQYLIFSHIRWTIIKLWSVVKKTMHDLAFYKFQCTCTLTILQECDIYHDYISFIRLHVLHNFPHIWY